MVAGGVGGTTGGVISSGEEDEEDEEPEEEEDDDMIGTRLLRDVKITAEDIVIVASFKLPITVYKDQVTGGWKVRQSKSMLYPTMFKLREKRKMVKIVWIGWPGVIPQSERE